LKLPFIPAGHQGRIPISQLDRPDQNEPTEYWLTITFRLKHTTAWAKAGHEIAWFQHSITDSALLTNHRPTNDLNLSTASHLEIRSSKLQYHISGPSFSIFFDRSRGSITQWTSHGRPILSQIDTASSPISISFYRAPTDNDIPHDLPVWLNYGLDSMTSQLRSFTISHQSPSSIQLTSTTFLSPPVLAWGFTATTTYTISSSGSLSIHTHLRPTGSHPQTLPRIGLDIHLSHSLSTATYFGLGPGESYPDKHSAQKLGVYTAPVHNLHTPYEVPQENGNRMGARWVTMLDGQGNGVRATRTPGAEEGPSLFQWAASPYSASELTLARHPHELIPPSESDPVYFRLDVASAGVGTAACGPGVAEQYQVKCREIEFEFRLDPVVA
jgi:beta-galactosidase